VTREIRRARPEEFDAIVQLELANMGTALDAEQKKDGFLSAYFNEDELAEIDANIGTIVCIDDRRLAGFMCVSDVDFNRRFTLPATMLTRFSQLTFDGRPVNDYVACICGPVCIDRDFRGQKIFESFYAALRDFVPANFNLATTLVSTANPRSLAAHRKVGLQDLDEFDWNDKHYVTLARLL
jgi:hypothetical protein